jgi:hypothetical protein
MLMLLEKPFHVPTCPSPSGILKRKASKIFGRVCPNMGGLKEVALAK